MNNDLKSGLGYIIPVGAIVGYVLAVIVENFNLAMILAVSGILLWFIYMLIMEIKPPQPFGNIIVLFGVLLAVSVFLATGLEQDIFGGYLLKTEGLIYAIMILFFTIMAGVLFRSMNQKQDMVIESQLSAGDRALVEQAIKQTDEKDDSDDPRIIVVKQETPVQEKETEAEELAAEQHDPYAYPYSPEYYQAAEEEDEYEDDEEDEYEDEEYEEYEDEEEEEKQ